MPDPSAEILTRQDAADLLGRHERTLRRWHQDGLGPARFKVNNTVLYRRAAIIAWIAEQERTGPPQSPKPRRQPPKRARRR